MPRKASSQWEFGELFTAEQTRRVLSVSDLTRQVKQLLEQHLGTVWVTGEISNLRAQSSGHIYFTLKDAATQLSCVLFRGERAVSRERLEDGTRVVLQGEVTVYEARGQYQLIVRQVELQGVGALQAAFERLKQKLAAEGLFGPERKRPLPSHPQCVGIVSSPTGAALRDVLHVVQRRNPALRLILAPCRVQGQGAADEIAEAIRLLNTFAAPPQPRASSIEHRASSIEHRASSIQHPTWTPEVILLTRGGGSLEDLWAFNEEPVARAIVASALPVVSAVGHEIDFTISDFASDLRAATPSAAAEILTEGMFSAAGFLREAADRLNQAAADALGEARDDLMGVCGRLGRAHPRRRLHEAAQRLDDLQSSLGRRIRDGLRRAGVSLVHGSARLQGCRPAAAIQTARQQFQREFQRLDDRVRQLVRTRQERLEAVRARLHLLGPEQVLARGYSITTDEAGRVVREAAKTRPGQRLTTRLHKGTVHSRVESGS